MEFVIPAFFHGKPQFPQSEYAKKDDYKDDSQYHGGEAEIRIGAEPHAVRGFHAEEFIQGVDTHATEHKCAQACCNADGIKDPDLDVAANQHVKASEQHGGMAEQSFENVVICQGGVVAEICVQYDSDDAADRAAVEAKFTEKLEQQALLVLQQGCDQEHPHDHITWVYRENLIILDGCTSCCEIINP